MRRWPDFSPRRAAVALLAAALAAPAIAREDGPLVVFAASSLTEALGGVAEAFAAEGGPPLRVSLASSATLARQIEAGARVDVFVSADARWMDYLAERDLIEPGTRRDLLGNELVLIAPADAALRIDIRPGFDLAGALGNGRLAMGDPAYVPAGRYAEAALRSLGAWAQVAARLLPAENVRVALAYVARGEAPLGVVYATDARIEPRVRVAGVFAADTHPPIVYPVALVRGAQPAAKVFLAFLASARAAAVLRALGFRVLAGPG